MHMQGRQGRGFGSHCVQGAQHVRGGAIGGLQLALGGRGGGLQPKLPASALAVQGAQRGGSRIAKGGWPLCRAGGWTGGALTRQGCRMSPLWHGPQQGQLSAHLAAQAGCVRLRGGHGAPGAGRGHGGDGDLGRPHLEL